MRSLFILGLLLVCGCTTVEIKGTFLKFPYYIRNEEVCLDAECFPLRNRIEPYEYRSLPYHLKRFYSKEN